MKKRLSIFIVIMSMVLSLFPAAAFAAGTETVTHPDITIYRLDSNYEDKLTIPEELLQEYQFPEKSDATYNVISGKSVKVTVDGKVVPKSTTWYWYDGFGTTSPPDPNSDNQPKSIVTEYTYGTTVVQVTSGTESYKVNIDLVNYAQTYVDQIIDTYLAEHITDDMTDYEKLDAITAFPAQYPYSAKYSGYTSMIIFGGGDCWASTSAIVELCRRAGLPAHSRYGVNDGGAGSGHRNAAVLVDGRVYVAEAGFSSTKVPRYYSITEENEGYFCYKYGDGHAALVQYDGFDTHLIVPEEVDGYPVTTIRKYAFGYYAALKPESIVLPESLTTLEDYALTGTDISEIRIPAGVTSIGIMPFAESSNLTTITVDEQNPAYCAVDNVLYDKDMKTLVGYPAGREGYFMIPDTVTTIPAGTFYECSNTGLIVMPKSVTSVGSRAFYGLYGLKVYYEGDKPEFDANAFDSMWDATFYYPEGNATWEEIVADESNNNITWVPWNPEEGLSECELNGHEYEYGTEVTNGTITGTCIRCGAMKTVNVPTRFYPYWENKTTGTARSTVFPNAAEGDVLKLSLSIANGDTGFRDFTVEVSDPDMFEITDISESEKELKVLKAGKAEISVCSKYNPGLKKTYTQLFGAEGSLNIADADIHLSNEAGMSCLASAYPSFTVSYQGMKLTRSEHYTAVYAGIKEHHPVITVTGAGIFGGTQVYEIPLIHKLRYVAGKEAACETEGKAECWECSYCGDVFADANGTVKVSKEDLIIPASGHIAEEIPAVPSSCTEDGLTAGSKCQICGKLLTAQEVVPATGHDWDEGIITKEPTCKEEGVRTYTCRHDGSHTRTEILPKTDHLASEPVTENKKVPTCTEDGSYDEVTYCSVCGKELSRKTVTVPATGHQAGEPEYIWEENYKQMTARIVCENDPSHILKEETTLTFAEIPANVCTEGGTIKYIAVFEDPDFETQEKEVAYEAEGHKASGVCFENEKEPTCTADGRREEVVYCSVCGAELSRKEVIIPAPGHDPGEPVRENIVPATDEQEGSYEEVVYCSVCGEELSRNTVIVDRVDKTELLAELQKVLQAMEKTAVSENGRDVDPSMQWVNKKVMDTLRLAVNAAQEVADTRQASQEETDQCLQELQKAYKDFEAAKKTGKKAQNVPLKGLTLNRTELEMPTASLGQLTVKFSPSDATDKDLVWTSSNPAVVSVHENGKLAAKTFGTATITVRSKKDPSIQASCNVQVWLWDATRENVSPEMFDAIYWAVDKKITGEKIRFGTNNTMTRGQFVRFLYRYAGNPKVTNSMIKKYGSKFKDVNSSYTHYKAIVWAVSKGLIGGYSDGTFKPEQTLTRNNVATILWKFAGSHRVASTKTPFADVKKSMAISWGKKNGIFAGSKFYPKQNCLRGDFAVFLYRYHLNCR